MSKSGKSGHQMLSRTGSGEQQQVIMRVGDNMQNNIGSPLANHIGMPVGAPLPNQVGAQNQVCAPLQSNCIGAPLTNQVGTPMYQPLSPPCAPQTCANTPGVGAQCQTGEGAVGAEGGVGHLMGRHQQTTVVMALPVISQQIVPVSRPGSMKVYPQVRTINWNWKFSMKEVATSETCLIAPLCGQAIAHMGICGMAAPNHIIPIKVTVLRTRNEDNIAPYICTSDWGLHNNFLTNGGQRGVLGVDVGTCEKEEDVYVLSQEKLNTANQKYAAIGRDIKTILAGVKQLSETTFVALKGTEAYGLCEMTFTSQDYKPTYFKECCTDEGFAMDVNTYKIFFGKVQRDFDDINSILVPLDNLKLKLELMRPARSKTATTDTIKASDLIDEMINSSGGGAENKQYLLEKINNVSVTLRVHYFSVQ
jgi:hypothetical protein